MSFLVALLVLGVSVAGCVHVLLGIGARPEALSSTATGVDAQFLLTLIITGIAFFVTQGLLLLYVVRYSSRRRGQPRHIDGNRTFEMLALVVCTAVFLFLAIRGQGVWARMQQAPDADPLVVEVLGEQFAWNVRLPGADGRFGSHAIELQETTYNPFGLRPDDALGRDDIVLLNEIVVPVGRTVVLEMRAKDVIHSLFIPALRIKQDLVPGLVTKLAFRAERTGVYEIACAELCGLGHYRMRGELRVLEPAAYEQWQREQR